MKKKQLLKGMKKSLSYLGDIRCENSVIGENYYLLIQKTKYALSQISRCEDVEFPHARDISVILLRYHYDISEQELHKEIKPINLTEGELRCLYPIMIYCCITALCESTSEAVISLMRSAGFYDYKRLYRSLSEVERCLLQDRDYRISNEQTRQMYATALEKYAKKRKISVVKAANDACASGLSKTLLANRHPIAREMYFFVIFIFFALFVFAEAHVLFVPFSPWGILPFLLSLLPIYECCVYLTNYSYGKLFFARSKPAVNISDIPKNVKTLAVITTLLNGDDSDAFEKIERYYLSNKCDGLLCGILADLPDCDPAEMNNDDVILNKANGAIKALCEKYGNVFFLFYRDREYSLSEKKLIAPERKRGAVCEMCKLLYTGESKLKCGNIDALPKNIKYLITLDGDTVLSPGGAERMIAAAEHPLNIPVIDEKKRKVIRGHGVLQPAVDTLISSSCKTPFSLISSGNGGVQSYADARFDIYEEVFSQGIFCGKGIINCEAFCKTVSDVFPDEKILSHDVAEGCILNSGMIPDVTLYDCTPSNALAYYKRYDRWVRGDIQTYAVLKGKYIKRKGGKIKTPLSAFDKYKLFDNVRRDLTPVFAILAMIAASFCARYICVCVAMFSLFYIVIPSFVSFIECIISGAFGVGRRFYSFAISNFWFAFLTLLWKISSLAHEGFVSAKATAVALWRLTVSHRGLLAWVSASQAEKSCKKGLLIYLIKGAFSILCGLGFLLLVPYGIYRITGLLFILNPFVSYLMSRPRAKKGKNVCTDVQYKELEKYVFDMWRYFNDTVSEQTHFLPPDNVQLTSGEKIAYRTSPTNIGLYLLSAVGAYKFGIIDKEKLYGALENTVSTVQKMKKYKGNLYNWYDIKTASPLNTFVSFVDSGNFLCCLVCVKHAIGQVFSYDDSLVEKIDSIIENTDISCMYDENENMFYIGTDELGGVTKGNHYDIYMSEARTSDLYGAARGITKNRLLTNMGRIVIGKSGYMGLASWTGTAFEYFMPCIFLPIYSNSLVSESLSFAYKRQREYKMGVGNMPRIYGTSESCYFEFDGEMNYQYKAHGTPTLGLKRGIEKDGVISPYSSFLMLCMGNDAFKNLKRIRQYGAYGKYGFYEAIDFTKSRVKGGFAVIKCFMSHHIGMSIAAAVNYAFDGYFVNCFISEPIIKSCLCLTEEKIPTDAPIYKSGKGDFDDCVYYSTRESKQPAASNAVISNSVCRYEIDECGNVFLYYGDVAVSAPCAVNTSAVGLQAEIYNGSDVYSLIRGVKPRCKSTYAEFNSKAGIGTLTVSGEKNVFCVSVQAEQGDYISFSFSPVMARASEYIAHVCYCRLFLQMKCQNGILIYKRKGFYTAVCIKDASGIIPFEYAQSKDGDIAPSYQNTEWFCPVFPDLFLKCRSKDCCILIACGKNETDVVNDLLSFAKCENATEENKKTLGKLYNNVLHCSYESEQILRALLLRTPRQSKIHGKSMNMLWKYGISGDNPIYTLDVTGENFKSGIPQSVITAVITHKSLLIKGVRYDTVILYKGNGYDNEVLEDIKNALGTLGALALLGQKNGIFAVEWESTAQREFFCDMSFYPYEKPCAVLCANEVKTDCEKSSLTPYHADENGVTVYSRPCLPWSFIYANENFGYLLTTDSLGYTWYINSRLGKLTAWNNDPTSTEGEKIYLMINENAYDAVSYSSKIFFGFDKAVYSGKIDKIKFTICVCCGEKTKMVSVFLTNTDEADAVCQVCYKADFCMGEQVKDYAYLHALTDEKSLTVFNTFCNMSECVLYSDKGVISAFDGHCGTLRCFAEIPCGKTENIEFSLGIKGDNSSRHPFDTVSQLYKKAVDELAEVITVKTDDREFDLMFNLFSKYQALYCRVYARCGFYQTGGAYGFRDQLQDMMCIMYSNPEYAREHILRCAEHQYEQGDVMHWWHVFPDKSERGIRTRCSDDMLWLAYVTGRYVRITGDDSVLFTPVPYLCSPPLGENEGDRYEDVNKSAIKESLYMHCVRAVRRACVFSDKGLALFAGGDWNDGMNNVGGESVWLSWFLYGVLCEMEYLSQIVKDDGGKAEYTQIKEVLYESIQQHAYNGQYYIRGTYSDGEVMGNAGGCKIDVLPQAFGAFYGRDKARKVSAMNAVWNELYDEENKLLQLFKPPFKDTDRYAGYISEYPAGIRENAGQYTHGAVWGAMGFFAADMNERGVKVIKALNPMIRLKNEQLRRKYKAEPYVFAGDIYVNERSTGRCGWSWYTGASGWYFTAVLEMMLGYKETENGFYLKPAFCNDFQRFTLKIKKKSTEYTVDISRQINDFFPFDGGSHTRTV